MLMDLYTAQVGFEITDDGQLNLHRPLYRCPACE